MKIKSCIPYVIRKENVTSGYHGKGFNIETIADLIEKNGEEIQDPYAYAFGAMGLVRNDDDDCDFTESIGDGFRVIVEVRERIIPPAVVKREIELGLQALRDKGIEPKRKDTAAVKDDVLNRIMPKALIKATRAAVVFQKTRKDDEINMFIFNATSKGADRIGQLLRKYLGTLPAVNQLNDVDMGRAMRAIYEGESDKFGACWSATLSPDDGSKVVLTSQDLAEDRSDTIIELLDCEHEFTKLGIMHRPAQEVVVKCAISGKCIFTGIKLTEMFSERDDAASEILLGVDFANQLIADLRKLGEIPDYMWEPIEEWGNQSKASDYIKDDDDGDAEEDEETDDGDDWEL